MTGPVEMKTTVELHLDQEDRRYCGGSMITGRVEVQAPRPEPCAGVEVRLWWAAYGEQDKTDEIFLEAEESLHGEGTLCGSYELPFSIQVPFQAPSHDGDTIWIDWSVTARVRGTDEQRVAKRHKITVVPAPLPDFLAHRSCDVGPYRRSGAGVHDVGAVDDAAQQPAAQPRAGAEQPGVDLA